MSEITWGTSQQKRLTLILDGHEFQKKLETKTTTHWKCSKWSSYKCKVTAITTGKQLLSKKNEHNHEIVPGHVQAKQIIGQMKETARTEQNPVNNMIIASSLLPIGSDIATQLSLPTRSAINRTLNRQKASENLQEPPITDRHFEVPAKFKEFCLYDTGTTDNERMLIFGTRASEIKGCYFHLCQSFNRKLCELGLKKIYENNPELALTLRMIPALSFVPEPMVSASFDLVIEEIQDVCEIAKLDTEYLQMIDDLTSYFQRTYIRGEKIGRINREPQYPLALWNHNKDAAEGLARTTNAVEGWHLGVTSLFQGNHPCIRTFLEKISLDAANQKFNIIKALSGKENKSRKKYRVLNENVKNIAKNFKTDDIVPYLRSLAYYTHS